MLLLLLSSNKNESELCKKAFKVEYRSNHLNHQLISIPIIHFEIIGDVNFLREQFNILKMSFKLFLTHTKTDYENIYVLTCNFHYS